MDTTTIHGEHKHRWYRITGLMGQFLPTAYTIPIDNVVAYGTHAAVTSAQDHLMLY